ncbi:serine hydrolase, partial [Lactobacillus nasalidis]
SNVPLASGHAYTIKELYRATLIESANGAALTLAQAVGGSQVAFVKKMRKLLTSWGITDAKIYNACGLANGNLGSAAYPGVGKNTENEMSAADMAIVCQKLLKDFPEVLNTTSIAQATFSTGSSQTQMTNWNWMLKGLSSYYSDLPVDGLKTGTTDKAGACFAGTVKKNGHRIITVVLGAKHTSSQDPSRFVQTAKLMHYVYQKYTTVVLKKGSSISGANTVKVPEGKQTSSKVVLGKTVTIWVKQGSQVKTSLSKSAVSAPVKKGAKVASYKFSSTSSKLPTLTGKTITASAVAVKDNQEANFFVRLWRSMFGSN